MHKIKPNSTCYHCGETVPAGTSYQAVLNGNTFPMCCPGCVAVAEVIHDSGLESYYKKRTANPRPIDEARSSHPVVHPELLDDDRVQSAFVRKVERNEYEAEFVIGEIHCPACVWLIENKVKKLDGVSEVGLNYSTHRLYVQWRSNQLKLSEIVRAIQNLGYSVSPYDPSSYEVQVQAQRKGLMRRMGIAGLLGMQVMILAVAMYFGDWTGIEIQFEQLFQRFSLLLTIPILFYCATPIFRGAARDLRARATTMDVPVALGLLLAFAGSLYATIAGAGDVYYDSIAMFVFLQLVSRFFQQSAQMRMSDSVRQLNSSAPAYASRLANPNNLQSAAIIPVARLMVGDYVVVRPGERVPADGIIVDGASEIDESVVTGESYPLPRSKGEVVIGGSSNLSNLVVVQISHVGKDTVLAGIQRLLERAQRSKPKMTGITDKIAAMFSISVVLIATCIAIFWSMQGNPEWLAHTISVLVVACPCALSLAAPTAMTVAVRKLAQIGILTTRANSIQNLARSDTFVFDKTGTLTTGKLALVDIQPVGKNNRESCLQIAAGLSSGAEHPISNALRNANAELKLPSVSELSNLPGAGVHGVVDGQKYFLGSAKFIKEHASVKAEPSLVDEFGPSAMLATESRLLCVFKFRDSLRTHAKHAISALQKDNISTMLVTGDREAEGKRIAKDTGINKVFANCTPNDKLQMIRTLQKEGQCITMVGDGINDAPVLAAADSSVASTSASHAVKVNSDFVLTSGSLMSLFAARKVAKQTLQITRQNVVWAVGYNLIGISLASAGLVPPFAAAIGMSASSLIVLYNSLRLNKLESDAKLVSTS